MSKLGESNEYKCEIYLAEQKFCTKVSIIWFRPNLIFTLYKIVLIHKGVNYDEKSLIFLNIHHFLPIFHSLTYVHLPTTKHIWSNIRNSQRHNVFGFLLCVLCFSLLMMHTLKCTALSEDVSTKELGVVQHLERSGLVVVDTLEDDRTK